MALAKPSQITVPFSSNGVKNTIPETATGSNLASMQEGFPVITMTDVDQGGMPPQGQDMNGILFDVTKAIQYQQAGGLFPYDATFAQAIDGYPLGALLTSADGSCLYQNTVSGNVSDPDNGGQGWSQILSSASIAGKQDKLTPVQMDAVNSGITSARVAIYDSYAAGKQDTLTFDNTPTNGSTNPVTSDGIYTALGTKQDTITVDAVPTSGSVNPVQSGGVYDALAEKVDISGGNSSATVATSTGSSTARTLANRFSDVINVKDFGAKGDGVTDDTSAFQFAVNYAVTKAIDNRQISRDGNHTSGQAVQNVDVSKETAVFVPAGNYKLSAYIDTSNIEVYWIVSPYALIDNYDYISGVVCLEGRRIVKARPYNGADRSVGFSSIVGCSASREAAVAQQHNYSSLGTSYNQTDVCPITAHTRDDMTLLAKIADATFNGNTLTNVSLTAEQQDGLRIGMRMQATDSSNNRFLAFITGWKSDYSEIYADGGWFAWVGGSTPVTPTQTGCTVLINGLLSMFGIVSHVHLANGSETTYRVTGFESLYENEDSSFVPDSNNDMNSVGPYVNLSESRAYGTAPYQRANCGYSARGNMWRGFSAEKDQYAGYEVRNHQTDLTQKQYGFIDRTGINSAFTAFGANSKQSFNVSANSGTVDLGNIGNNASAILNFHSSGNASLPYDARIYSATSSGVTTLRIQPAGTGNVILHSRTYPSDDNSLDLGISSNRWANIYAGNGTIQTSDERLKSNISGISDDVLDAWGDVNLIVFQFKDALEKKGDSARIHAGVIAQQVKSAFEARGLDAFRYGLLCYDKWEETDAVTEIQQVKVTDEVIDDDGNIVSHPTFKEVEVIVTPAQEAGDKFSIRYEEALIIEAAYQRRRADRIESRLKAVEERMR